ncbi:3-oxo-Delta(4,5)-steroid 5-beta-reductase [Typha angustifolia]|uniref:3-oxo-Delta(4,5)-steroid 5-beta-reductase n=1 Tax=Typha angustifolia TaxID=59011 RepID=UPI003C2FCE8D
MEKKTEKKVALVAGSTGLVGKELVRVLSESADWELVYGVARKAPSDGGLREGHVGKYRFLECDLLDVGETRERVGPLAEHVTHLFWVTWASQFALDTVDCCDLNRAMISNALDALLRPPRSNGDRVGSTSLRHVSLQTGTKHYVSLKEIGTNNHGDPYAEESPRVAGANSGSANHNFYYAVEDVLRDRFHCERSIMSWSVHRPGLLFGLSERSHFNVIGTLSVYAAICSHLHLPFLFCGTRHCWEDPFIDASDARLVARQHIWWASSPLRSPGRPETFNAVDDASLTWKEVWPALAARFGLPSPSTCTEEVNYCKLMEGKREVWDEIVRNEGLKVTKMEDLANWGFLDALFRFPGKLLASPAKARRLGFAATYSAVDSVLYWVDRMREERLIPNPKSSC